jgi:hypothetical protein
MTIKAVYSLSWYCHGVNQAGAARFRQAITFRRGYAQAFPLVLMSISNTKSEKTSEGKK